MVHCVPILSHGALRVVGVTPWAIRVGLTPGVLRVGVTPGALRVSVTPGALRVGVTPEGLSVGATAPSKVNPFARTCVVLRIGFNCLIILSCLASCLSEEERRDLHTSATRAWQRVLTKNLLIPFCP